MTASDSPEQEPGAERIVITDKRRVHVDAATVPEASPDVVEQAVGQAVEAVGQAVGQAVEAVDEPVEEPVERAVEERGNELLADLQRVTAEYANYRKRVDRDRVAVIEMATAGLLDNLLPLLDDVDRARQHGDLTGGFKGVGEGLEAVVAKLGLERFGVVGEPFDPAVHEALMQAPEDPESAVATCAQVLQQGYRLTTGRVLRPARVAVAEPGLTVTVEPPGADVPAPGEG